MEINFDVINNKDIVKVISGCNHVVILSEQRHVYALEIRNLEKLEL